MKKLIKMFLIITFFILLIGSNNFVLAAEDIEIKISPNNTEWTTSNVMLIIDTVTNQVFDSDSHQAVQILLGEESPTNKWMDLGSDVNALALKKSYTYIIKKNTKVSVRVVTWKLEDKSDLKQLALQTYEVSNIDRTNPVIEKIEPTALNNSIKLKVVAKDSESGIQKYNCKCAETAYEKSSETPEFEITNLKENKEYIFEITVFDKLNNKVTTTKKIITKQKNNQNNVENTNKNTNINTNTNTNVNITNNINTNIVVNNTITDTTVANKIIPQIGKSKIFFALFLSMIIIIVIEKPKDRI